MAHTEAHAGVSVSKKRLSASRPKGVATIVSALRKWRRNFARRKALAGLTPDQLRDIGQPGYNRPVLEIKAGLMAKLMSMR
jgi:uncharacterized protein YjiS (DUF1127 family)